MTLTHGQGQGQGKAFEHITFTSSDNLKKFHCNEAYLTQKRILRFFKIFDLDIGVIN